MRFLVQVTVELPDDLREPDSPRRSQLLEAELRRGVELHRSGAIERIWRVPGMPRNVGIWQAADATELHELISSLPLAPWLRVEVTPLALHPVERELGLE